MLMRQPDEQGDAVRALSENAFSGNVIRADMGPVDIFIHPVARFVPTAEELAVGRSMARYDGPDKDGGEFSEGRFAE